MLSCGKSKTVYYGETEDRLEMHFLDSVSSYTQNKNARIPGTGEVRCAISSYLFKMLEQEGLPTHYLANLGRGRMEVKRLEMFKLEVIPRNRAAGSIVRNFPIQRGHVFDPPVLKMDLKYDNDPMLNDDYILALGVATKQDIAEIRELAFALNDTLTDFFMTRGLQLVDFKFEVGRTPDDRIVIGDELSPDGMRLWDAETGDSLDKDVFRYDTGDLSEAYNEVARRVLEGAP
jgi:phosphoribosylaminoimidazole-succinocarboxamide synthase